MTQHPEPAATANPKSPISATYKLRILIADDDPRLLQSLQSLLALRGFSSDVAHGGEEAIAMLTATHYDLLLLDLNMPFISGHEVMETMRARQITTQTIVVSGETSIDDVSRALRNGAYDYIKKPYVPDELLATINNAAQNKRLADSHQIMQTRLDRSEKMHRMIVNNSPDIIYILDRSGCFSFLNEKIESLLGYPRESLIGKHLTTLVDPCDHEKVSYLLEQARLQSDSAHTLEISLLNHSPSRQPHYFELSIWPHAHPNDGPFPEGAEPNTIYGTARDITERREAQAFINFQAYHDLLTRLPNRSLFKDRLGVALTHAQRNSERLAVIFIDLDRFKVVNDSLGHTMGDRLLQAVSQRLQGCIRKGDTLARFGGDEFTLLLPDAKNEAAAVQVAEKILTAIEEPFELNGHEIYVGASIGIALYPDAGISMDSLIKHADIAMYKVKNSGKNGYQLFTQEMKASTTERLVLERDMRHSIQEGDFMVYYQPQVDATTRQLSGVEALVRWQHPKHGYLSPAAFIPIAEESQLIVELDKQTLRIACREIKQYHQNGFPNLRLSVNLSPRLVERKQFVEEVLAILDQEQFPKQLLELEITENILINDQEHAIQKMSELSQHGIRFAIDDFGTGYSSLSYLQRFPIQTLKIDRSFVSNLQEQRQEACIVNAIVSMALGLNMDIVAEGVENLDQFHYLHDIGCQTIQGYLFGTPNRIELVTQHFANNTPYQPPLQAVATQ